MTDKKNVVYYDAPLARPAPVRETGLIAWVRANLVRTPSDVFLTVVFSVLVIGGLASFINWAIHDANWWAVSFNFRQFMMGAYEPDLEWRLAAATVVTTFILGMAVAVWIKKIARVMVILIAVMLVLLWVLPMVTLAVTTVPPVYIAAGSKPVIVGNATDAARPLLAFTGKAGEVITLQEAPISNDEQLTQLAGFMDQPTNAMRSVALDRFADIAEKDVLEAELARNTAADIPLLTPNQITRKQADLAKLLPIAPVTETLTLNETPVLVEVLDNSGEPIAAGITLASSNETATFTLPRDGWYVLRTSTPDTDGLSILAVTGMGTLLETNGFDAATRTFIPTYTRMLDNMLTVGPLPKVGTVEPPFYDIIRNQYWGSRPFEAWLRIYVAPFLQFHALNATLLLLAAVAGYQASLLIERLRGRHSAGSVAQTSLLFAPVFIWVMATGLSIAEILNLSVFLGAVFFILLMRVVGARLGLTWRGLIVWQVGFGAVMALPLALFSPHYGFGILPLLNIVIVLPSLGAWIIGSDSYKVADPRETDRAFGLYGVLTLTCLFIPLILVLLGVNPQGEYPDWLLRSSDQRLWGGLLLTFILTIFGIVVSFPIGVLLAVGRRSNLPAVKYGCTLYIEVIRGSPFITVLFLAQLFIPLINPSFANIPGTIRALVATILFSAAYLAENIRGGLQSLPPGQAEAAKALGLSGWQVVYYITMPQALRAVIPALLGSFVSLFKDTSLVAIVGLTDITGFVSIMVAQSAFTGTRAEGLLFVTLIYFVVSYGMSYVSRLLEMSGSGAARRI